MTHEVIPLSTPTDSEDFGGRQTTVRNVALHQCVEKRILGFGRRIGAEVEFRGQFLDAGVGRESGRSFGDRRCGRRAVCSLHFTNVLLIVSRV